MGNKRVNIKAILADADLRRKLMVPTIQATQAREGIETTTEEADRAYRVVREVERAVFFDLERFRGHRDQPDQRHLVFVNALRDVAERVRIDIARRDFGVLPSAALAYQRVAHIGHLFREHVGFEPKWGIVRQGLITGDDAPFYRFHWEVTPVLSSKPWVPLNKGGSFQRFYFDTDLVVDWSAGAKKAYHRLREESLYFRKGITWPYRSQKGFCPRLLDGRGVHSHVGHSAFPGEESKTWFLLAVFSSAAFEQIITSLSSFGKYEIGMVKSMPIPESSAQAGEALSAAARSIYESKAAWDEGNEISTHFRLPWLLSLAPATMQEQLTNVANLECAEEEKIQLRYSELNEIVYRLYGVSASSRRNLELSLGQRPEEILWPQMEGKTAEQKRMEHVWRLLSYTVKRVLESDDDGIVPFNAVNGDPRLVDRVHRELATLFPTRDANQFEVEIVNELKKTVKGYRKCASLEEWLDNVFFEYHVGLYKNRPIFWHIASSQGTSRFAFGVLVHYHRFDKNRMAMLRASYLRDAIEEFRREAGLAGKAGRNDDRLEWQAKVEEAQALDTKLQLIQEGHHEGAEGGDRDYRILTPWKQPSERPKGWDPDIDDGVKVNIAPFERAGVLRVGGKI